MDLNCDLELLENLLQKLPSCIFFKDTECRYRFSTKYCHNIITNGEGWTINGKTDLDVQKDKRLGRIFYEEDKKILETGKGISYVSELNNDGINEYLEIIREPVFDDNGDIIGIVGLINDVTDSIKLQKGLSQLIGTDHLTGLYNRYALEEWLSDQMSSERFPLCTIVADFDDLKGINNKYGHKYGDELLRIFSSILRMILPKEAMIFRLESDDFIAILPKTSKEEGEKYLKTLMSPDNQLQFNGEKFSVIYVLQMMNSPQEDFKKVMTKAEMEMNAKKQERKEQAIYSANYSKMIIDGLCKEYESVWYVDGENDLTIPYVLADWLASDFGIESQVVQPQRENILKYIDKNVEPEDRSRLKDMTKPENVKRELEEKGFHQVNYRAYINGAYENYQLKIVRVGEVNQQVWAFRNVEDILKEEEKQRQVLSEALDKAKQGEAAKTNFLLNMSHDIRTPMNAILGYNKIALDHMDDPALVKNSVEKVDIVGKQMLAIVNDVLEMSSIENGEIKLTKDIVDPKEHLYEIADIFYQEMENKGISFKVETDYQVGTVAYDRYRVMQVVNNLLSNALKFTPAGGTVWLKGMQVKDESDGKINIEIRVKDTGIGMGESFQKKIFTQFERERTTTVSGVQGTGLGLAIAHKVAEKMGGTLSFTSEQGVGSEFVFLFQAEPITKAVESQVKKDRNYACFSGKRVLVVEDHKINREIAKYIMLDAGFLVDEAEDGLIAVEKVRCSAPGYYDLVLMDIQMPVMDGYEATKRIRSFEDERLSKIPIVAVTANSFIEERKKALEYGMNEHVSKPINVAHLLEVIADVLS